MSIELSDQEFACLVMRKCGVSNIPAALGADHPDDCMFCTGKMRVV